MSSAALSPRDDGVGVGTKAAAAATTAAAAAATGTGSGSTTSYNRKRKRRQPRPEFCDASATLSCPAYAARRLPEIRQLYYAAEYGSPAAADHRTTTTRIESSLLSGGRKISSRHLRRRAASHAGRRRHRFPAAVGAAAAAAAAAVGGTAAPPASSCGGSRRKRRKHPHVLRAGHEGWRLRDRSGSAGDNVDGSRTNDNDSDDDNNANRSWWIPTHVWHAKRFLVGRPLPLENGGWAVPIAHGNRGPAAAVRLCCDDGKCLIQDSTWCMQPVCLRVPLPEQQQQQQSTHQQQLQQLLSRCIPEFLLVPGGGGKGLLHEVDRFPAGAVGPIQWLVLRNKKLLEVPDDDDKKTDDALHLYFWVHPLIRDELSRILNALAAQGLSYPSPRQERMSISGMSGGLAYLKLRGSYTATTDCLSAAFPNLFDEGNPKDLPPNGAVIAASLPPYFDPNQQQHFEKSQRPVLLTYHSVRDPGLPCNNGVNGFDLMCHPDAARALFVRLVVQGGACAIGLAEEMHVHLEASPPVPFFPRDFPDTRQGSLYWRSIGDEDGDGIYTNGEGAGKSSNYCLLRSVLECGTGRIARSLKQPASRPGVDWTSLVDNDSGSKETVVVRGSFGKPFLDTLVSGTAGYLVGASKPDNNARKKRRRRSHASVTSPPLSREDAKTHEQLCNTLLRSLSLPALLLCQVIVAGKGTVLPGSCLFEHRRDEEGETEEAPPLGYVTMGVFSPSRGTNHGLALCGATRLLRAIADASKSGMLTIHNKSKSKSQQPPQRHEGTRDVLIRVKIGYQCQTDDDDAPPLVAHRRDASIRLLF